jgi:hypothetical protein
MYLEIEFEEQDNSFDLEFEQVTEISDGGFDRGYAEGYENGKGDGLTEGYAKGETEGYGKGYEQGNTDGYTTGKTEGVTEGFADALAKRTELVVTDSGEYVPEGESTGFKKVTVGIQKGEDLDAVVAEQAELIGELSATLDEKIGAYDVGYDAALEKLTDLVATENGEYAPPEGSTGFKSVSVNVQAKSVMDLYVEGTATEVGGIANKVRASAFKNDTRITSATFPNATSVGAQAFVGCSSLATANFPSATSVGESAFQSCQKLINVELPNVTSLDMSAFSSCAYLVNFDLPKIGSIRTFAFRYCYSLKAVILRSETLCTLENKSAFDGCYHLEGTVSATFNPNGDKDGYIYVPANLVNSYKRATNWSKYASQIRALEDYTVDGTINGVLDPNKI